MDRPRPTLPAAAALAAAAITAITAISPTARADDKYALAMFHFNVQYVAGGMVGYYTTPNPEIDLDAEAVEDRIVTESFAPVLDLYAAHPTWGADIELQGYLLDVLAARHPATLATLRSLAKSGQIDVLSFHYSDQLFIAHPYEDWSRSQELTAKTFARYDIPLGKSVFCQEGQAGAVMAREMKARGYETMIWPKNLWTYQHGGFSASPDPIYRFGDVSLIVGAHGVDWQDGVNHVQVAWTFFDDGELLATGDKNPYFPDIFKKNDQALADYEAELSGLAAQGFQITTVSKYAAAMKALVTPKDPPPLLDGTWQPGSTDAVHRWLGGGGLWGADERDNDVRTLASLAHRELLAAETIAAEAGIEASGAIASAARLIALGEVSDASGINPFRGEAEYGIGHLTEALRVARGVIGEAKAALGLGAVSIDPARGKVTEGAADELRGEETAPAVEITIDAGGREVSEAWEVVREGLTRVELAFAPGESRYLTVRFPGVAADPIVTTLALDDVTPASFSRKDFSFESFYLPLPIGVIGLGGGSFLIQDQAYVHIAAQVFTGSGDIVFADETATAGESARWVFYLLEGTAEEAVELAGQINDRRSVSR